MVAIGPSLPRLVSNVTKLLPVPRAVKGTTAIDSGITPLVAKHAVRHRLPR